jgi:hypothetical protein
MARTLLVLIACLLLAQRPAAAVPPFSGTIFIDPDIITAADPTRYTGMTYTGQGIRLMYDRRIGAFANYNAYLFATQFSDGLSIEIQVNPEFGSSANAQAQAEFYAPVIGRLPRALRVDVQTVWLHQGDFPFGGGNHNLLIHNGSIAQSYVTGGILEEAFVHEASHTSLDATHASAPGWLAAQAADPEFISTYARDNPTQEDIAESFLPWLAVRHRPERITVALANTITSTIPNRIAYFDGLTLDLAPVSSAVFKNGFE